MYPPYSIPEEEPGLAAKERTFHSLQISKIQQSDSADPDQDFISEVLAIKLLPTSVTCFNSFDEEQLCKIHSQRIKNLCLRDGERICSDCALFGPHQGHPITRLSTLFQQFEQKGKTLTALLEQQKRKQGSNTMAQLNRRRENIIQQIKRRREQMIYGLQCQANQLQQQVVQHFDNLQMQLYQRQTQSLFKSPYQQWESKVKNLTAQSPTFQRALRLLQKYDQLFAAGTAFIKGQRGTSSQQCLYQHAKIVPFQGSGLLGLKFVRTQDEQDKALKQQVKPKSISMTKHITSKTNIPIVQEQLLLEGLGNGKTAPRTSRLRLQTQSIVVKDFEAKTARQRIKTQKDQVRKRDFKKGGQKLQKSFRKLIPAKFQKIIGQLLQDRLEVVDLSNGQLGDKLCLQLLQPLNRTQRPRVLKLIHNKLTDELVRPLLRLLEGTQIRTLSLAQNLLTDRAVDLLLEYCTGQRLKSVTLSQNRVNVRNVKVKLQLLKARGVLVSI